MHRRIKRIAVSVCAFVLCLGVYHTEKASAAQTAAVDTIVLETEAASQEDVPVDMKWKTSREGGRWVESLSVSQDVESLVLILNDEDPSQYITSAASEEDEYSAVRKRDIFANSRLLYYSKNADGKWQEVFSTACILSGGEDVTEDELSGMYRASEAFGTRENPGSLVSYRQLTEKDYWITDQDSEQYGTIVRVGPKGPQTALSVQLESMKAYSNYGMVLRPEEEGEDGPALLMNCLQEGTVETTLAGVQIPQNYVRMLIQSIDSNTRIVIAADVMELDQMQ